MSSRTRQFSYAFTPRKASRSTERKGMGPGHESSSWAALQSCPRLKINALQTLFYSAAVGTVGFSANNPAKSVALISVTVAASSTARRRGRCLSMPRREKLNSTMPTRNTGRRCGCWTNACNTCAIKDQRRTTLMVVGCVIHLLANRAARRMPRITNSKKPSPG